MAADAWAPAPAAGPALGADEVHVWRASLRPPDAVLRRLEAHLSPDERARAARFRFPEHRQAFVAGRGIQREILSRYTGVAPALLAYRLSAHDKPALDGPRRWPRWPVWSRRWGSSPERRGRPRGIQVAPAASWKPCAPP